MRLLDPRSLESSSIVANRTMNRERRLMGSGGYRGELKLDVLAFLRERSRDAEATWTDLCCGTARALIDAAEDLSRDEPTNRVRIEGVDLVGMFAPNPHPGILTLRAQSVEQWQPGSPRALITCVHGLHYVGDKLAAIAKCARHLAPGGLFVASLDLANVRRADGRPAGRLLIAWLRRNGVTWDSRRRLVSCRGPRDIAALPQYLGADDAAGPNYTGQPAVASHYAL